VVIGLRLFVAKAEDIREGKITDIYFVRTKKIIKEMGLTDIRVRMEVHTGGLPKGYSWAVYAGLEEALAILSGKPVNVYSLPEGTLVKEDFPLMVIEGKYYDIVELETPVLGVLRHSTAVASKASRIKRLAMNRTILFFGLRAAHPAIAPALDRAAYIGGLDAVSGAFNEEYIGVKPVGTMPHALVIIFGEGKAAWVAFDKVIEPEVPRVALIDTFNDERVEALEAIEALGDKLYGIRLDTPRSRRGNMREIIKEIKWVLKMKGFQDVKIVVSGGINEKSIIELRDVADAFGVGTSVAFPPSVDISMDIVEIDRGGGWKPISKRGKLPGFKQVYRCNVLDYEIVEWDKKPERCTEPMLIKYMDHGKLIKQLPTPKEIRDYVLGQVAKLPEPTPT